jgi:glycerophosphoryl diester phosphodiesterase
MNDSPLAIGHRGAPTVAIENTLPSIEAAIRAGARWVEIDVKLTSDQVPVLLHDRTLRRIWGRNVKIGKVSLSGLRRREPMIPTLREALEYIRGRGVRLLIDLPSAPEAAPSIGLVQELRMVEETAFTGDTDALAEVRAREEDAMIAMTWDRRGLAGEDVLARVRPQYFNQAYTKLNAATVDAARSAGLKVSTYTVDAPDDIRRMTDLGVDAIISNEIKTLVGILSGRPA